jgi:hypothetical protein
VLFHYQQWQANKKLKKKLVERTAVEVKENLELLGGQPQTFENGETGKPLGPPVVLAPLSTTALGDWMRSNVSDPEDVRDAMKREGFIHAHNKLVEVLLSQWSADTRGLAHSEPFCRIISNVAERQKVLRAHCTYELSRLQANGVEVPDYPARRLSGTSEPAECRNCGGPLDSSYPGACPECGEEAGKIVRAGAVKLKGGAQEPLQRRWWEFWR